MNYGPTMPTSMPQIGGNNFGQFGFEQSGTSWPLLNGNANGGNFWNTQFNTQRFSFQPFTNTNTFSRFQTNPSFAGGMPFNQFGNQAGWGAQNGWNAQFNNAANGVNAWTQRGVQGNFATYNPAARQTNNQAVTQQATGATMPTSMPRMGGQQNTANQATWPNTAVQQRQNTQVAMPTFPNANAAAQNRQANAQNNGQGAQNGQGQAMPQQGQAGGATMPTSMPGMPGANGGQGGFKGQDLLNKLPFVQGLYEDVYSNTSSNPTAANMIAEVQVGLKPVNVNGQLVPNMHTSKEIMIAQNDSGSVKTGDILMPVHVSRYGNDPITGWVFKKEFMPMDVNSDGREDAVVRVGKQAYRNLGQHPRQAELVDAYGDANFVTSRVNDINGDGKADEAILMFNDDGSEQEFVRPVAYRVTDKANKREKRLEDIATDFEANQDKDKIYEFAKSKYKVHKVSEDENGYRTIYLVFCATGDIDDPEEKVEEADEDGGDLSMDASDAADADPTVDIPDINDAEPASVSEHLV